MTAAEEFLQRSTALTSPYQPSSSNISSEPAPRSKAPTAATQAAWSRLAAYNGSAAAAKCQLLSTAVCGAHDILDDFYDSCRTVLLFELWKLKRTALWDTWMVQLEQHVNTYRVLTDRQAFAGNMYKDAAREKKDLFAKDQERRHRFLKDRRHETAVYVKGLQKHPLYMSPASPPRQGSGGVDSSDDSHISRRRHQPNTNAAISSAVGTSSRSKAVGKSMPTKSSRFVQGVLQRMAEAAAAAAYPSADQTPSSSSYTASPPPPDLTPLGGVLGHQHHHQQQQHRNTSPPHHRQHLDDDNNDNSSGVDELMIIRQTSSPPPSAILQRPPSSNRTPAVTFSAPGEQTVADQ